MPDKKTGEAAQTLSFASNRVDSVERVHVGGKTYLVAPVSMLVPGVLNGELVPAEEASAFVSSWDGRPVTMGHPKDGEGQAISANDPDVLLQYQVGQVFAAYFDDALRAEMWVDVDRAMVVEGGYSLLQRLSSSSGTEVSTAYWRTLDETPGSLLGVPYTGVARDLRPDHLAVLLDESGACSWEDGCGFPRVNVGQEETGNTGIMVAFYLPDDLAESLHIPAGNATSILHLTLAYLGDIADPHYANLDRAGLSSLLRDFADNQRPLSGTLGGVGRFNAQDDEGRFPTVTFFDCADLPEMRQSLVGWLASDGYPIARNHGYIPHVTLGYDEIGSPLPHIAEIDMVIDVLTLVVGDDREYFPVGGEVDENAPVGQPRLHKRGGEVRRRTVLERARGAILSRMSLPVSENPPTGADGTPQVNDGEKTMMTICEKVAAVQARYKLSDNADLSGLDEAALDALLLVEEKQEPKANEETDGEDEDPDTPPVENTVVLPENMVALLVAIEDLGGVDAFVSHVQRMKTTEEGEKTAVISRLSANEQCALSADQLSAMPLDTLLALDASFRPTAYLGAAGAQPVSGEIELYEAPDIHAPTAKE